jgi:hypothetical protein
MHLVYGLKTWVVFVLCLFLWVWPRNSYLKSFPEKILFFFGFFEHVILCSSHMIDVVEFCLMKFRNLTKKRERL